MKKHARDFTLYQLEELLTTLKSANVNFITLRDYYISPQTDAVILRHDIDDRKSHALSFAKIQHQLGIRGTYYFRMVKESFDPEIISQIESLGHEIGYHYEDMDFAKGDVDRAYELFQSHLKKLRSVANIQTICMHGSPRSDFDNKSVWDKYNYKESDILCEPYLDFDFDKMFYLTDTGRMWDGHKYSIRDIIATQRDWPRFHSTQEIIQSVKGKTFPFPVMFNFHPQRWSNNHYRWTTELIQQSIKNVFKAYRKSRLK